MVTIPDGPGLGIEVNEEFVRERARKGHRWRTRSGATPTAPSPNGDLPDLGFI
jgi:hypothetical protein